ncbi:hypothetical protein F5884DRAFT_658980 [Xylogone sp. PMI_703]|nr:hypothetical protein F5884DRAFT_658980 [Xylogone sp. PMI_703]
MTTVTETLYSAPVVFNTPSPSKKDARARLNYFDWQEIHEIEKPYQIFIEVENENDRTSNLTFREGPEEVIHDVRGQEGAFTLDTTGFAFRKHVSSVKDFQSRSVIEKEYLPECEKVLMDELDDVDEVFIFDWRLRNTIPVPPGTTIDMNNPMELLKPARHVHIDQSPAAAVGRTQRHLPDRAEELLQGRLRIVNIWRPLNHPVMDNALALCDGRTILDSDKVEADHIRRQYSGSTYYVKYNDRYRWHYLREQRPDEITLVKCFDSDPTVTKCSPHSSFSATSPTGWSSALPRESIEVRALVFTYV